MIQSAASARSVTALNISSAVTEREALEEAFAKLPPVKVAGLDPAFVRRYLPEFDGLLEGALAYICEAVRQSDLPQDVLEYDLRLRELPRAGSAAGQTAHRGRDDGPAVFLQLFQIILCGGILQHICVHGRGDEPGAAAGQEGGAEHIVPQAMGDLGADVGGGGGHDHQIRPVRQGDMLHFVHRKAVEGIRIRLPGGQMLEGEGGDELCCVLRHHHVHLGMELHQGRRQVRRLIGRDPPGDPQQYGFSFQHVRRLPWLVSFGESLYPRAG